jgi:hypothetical protein
MLQFTTSLAISYLCAAAQTITVPAISYVKQRPKDVAADKKGLS